MRLNVIDWNPYHETDETGGKAYAVRAVGRTSEEDGAKSVYLRVDGFTPFFYAQVPDNWNNLYAEALINTVKGRLWKRAQEGLVSWKLVTKYRFRGFTNKKRFKFIQLAFANMQSFRAWEKVLRNKINVEDLTNKMQPVNRMYPLYESNIEPLLRLIHLRKLTASGWIEIDERKARKCTDSINDITYAVNWRDLHPAEGNKVAPLTIACYDIECTSEDGGFPQAHRDGDKITMIGTTYSKYGEDECYYKHIAVLDTCDPIPGATVESCRSEGDVLTAWKRDLRKQNPDIVITYNGFGFDDEYIVRRAEKCELHSFMHNLGRVRNHLSELKEKKLSSSALGDNVLHYIDMVGRIQIDLMKVVQRDHKLDSYRLDYVAGHFIREDCVQVDAQETNAKKRIKPPKRNGIRCNFRIEAKSTKGIKVGDFVAVQYDDGISVSAFGEKFPVIDIEKIKVRVKAKVKERVKVIDKKTRKEVEVEQEVEREVEEERSIIWTTMSDELEDELNEIQNATDEDGEGRRLKWVWAQAKDDMSPKRMFQLQKRGPADRALIAKYCLQDCALGNRLMNKLQIINNNIGMSNVCSVPLSYLFLRGQGIKGTSLVAKRCREEGYLIPVLPKPPVKYDEDGKPIEVEQAAVGYEGATVLEPIKGVYLTALATLDFNSLYPNSIISKNLSHETIVDDPKYLNLEGYYYFHTWIRNTDGTVQCVRSAQSYEMEKGIVPAILDGLLTARKDTKKLMETEKDPFMKKILDGLQNAYKVTANSLYGLMGAATSAVYYRDIAAATTATGRDMLKHAVKIVKRNYPDAIIIYGDTDSIFIKFNIVDENGEEITDKRALVETIRLGKICADLINASIPPPQKIVFEKAIWPFAIISKKRYLGLKWEDTEKGKPMCMGIVLKRRDNALICKDVFGGIVHRILYKRSKEKAIAFLKKKLVEILNGKVPMSRFIISKTLRSSYKNPESIAHYQLALRMAQRDAGNKVQSNERVRYVFVRTDKNGKEPKDQKQVDKVEDPVWAVQNNIPLDYVYYIRRQIMVPVCQFMSLVMKNPEEIFERVIEKEMHRRRGANVTSMSKFFATSQANDDDDDDDVVDEDFEPNVRENQELDDTYSRAGTDIDSDDD
jgi:DNA polymerase elongation subunit (family B)